MTDRTPDAAEAVAEEGAPAAVDSKPMDAGGDEAVTLSPTKPRKTRPGALDLARGFE